VRNTFNRSAPGQKRDQILPLENPVFPAISKRHSTLAAVDTFRPAGFIILRGGMRICGVI
jgi:hypothetical protein